MGRFMKDGIPVTGPTPKPTGNGPKSFEASPRIARITPSGVNTQTALTRGTGKQTSGHNYKGDGA